MRGARFPIALLAVAMLLLAAWLLLPDMGADAPAVDTAQAVPAPTAGPASAAANGAAPTAPTAPAASANQRIEAPPLSTVTPASATAIVVHGRCVDPHHRPVAGCDLIGIGLPAAAMPRTRSAADGTFAFTLDLDDGSIIAAVRVERPGAVPLTHQIDELVPGRDCDLGDLLIAPGKTVRGRIVDAHRQPLPGAGVTFVDATVREGIGPLGPVVVQSDSQGRFATCLAPGMWSVKTVLHRLSAGSIEVADDDTATEVMLDVAIEVMLETPVAHASITGSIIDADGKGVAARLVRARSDAPDLLPGLATSNSDGNFTIEGRADAAPIPLAVVADGYQPWQSTAPVPYGTNDLRIVLTPAAPTMLRLHDAGGAAVTDARVFVWRRNGAPTLVLDGPWREGEVALDPLPIGAGSVLVLPADPLLACTARQFMAFAAGGRTDIVVPRRCERVLSVRGSDGAPVADAHYELLDAAPSRLQHHGASPSAWARLPEGPLLLHEGSTGADGRTALSGPGDRPLWLLLRGGFSTLLLEVGLRDQAPLVVTVSAGAALHARIGPAEAMQKHCERRRMPGPVDPSRFMLRLHRSGDDRRREDCELHFDATATGRIEHLAPGTWHPLLCLDRVGFADLAPVVLATGETRELTVDLTATLPGVLHGSIEVEGRRLIGAVLHLRRVDDRGSVREESAVTDANGNYRLIAAAATYAATVTLPADSLPLAAGEVTLVADTELQRDFAMHTTLLRLRVVDADGHPAAGVVLHLGSGPREDWALPATDAEGRTAIAGDGSGRFAVRVGIGGPRLGEVDAARAGEQVLTLPAGR